jgi:hypothetical protein
VHPGLVSVCQADRALDALKPGVNVLITIFGIFDQFSASFDNQWFYYYFVSKSDKIFGK